MKQKFKMEVSDGFFCEAYDFPLVISQSAQSFVSARFCCLAIDAPWRGNAPKKGMANMGVLTPDWGLSLKKRRHFLMKVFGDVEF